MCSSGVNKQEVDALGLILLLLERSASINHHEEVGRAYDAGTYLRSGRTGDPSRSR
jgi:hypothetical protein